MADVQGRGGYEGHKQLKKSEPDPDLGLPLINSKGLHQKTMTVLEWAP